MSKSMLTPPEREQYVVGALAKAVGKAVKPKRKYKPRRSREQIDADNAKILEQKKAKKEAKEEAKLRQEKSRGTWRFEGNFFDDEGRKEYLLKREEPEGTGAFRAAYRYAWQKKKDTFMHKGDEYSTDLNMGNTQESLLVSPEREQYFAGAIVKLIKAGVKKGTEAYKKLDRQTKEALDKAQGITKDTPGATAKNRGAVIGKARTAAFEKSAQNAGRIEGAAGTLGLTTLAEGVSSLFDNDEDSKVSYSIKDLPMEGAIVTKETKSGTTTYSNSAFKRAAQKAAKAGESNFSFDGDSYNVMGSLEALDRFKMNNGGEVYDQELSYVPPSTAYEQRQQAERDFQERLRKNEEQAQMRQLIRENKGMTVEQAYAEVRRKDDEARKKYDEDENRLGRAEGGKFPDLTGDGEITQADVLKGRGVFREGSLVTKKEQRRAIEQAATDIFSKYSPDDMPVNIGFLPPVRTAVAELKDGANIKDVKKSMTDNLMFEYFPKEYKSQEQEEIKEASKRFSTKRGDDRTDKAEGSLMMPEEGMPVDTYPNIPEDEMDEALASQLPDDEMEDDYISYVMDESLDDDEQDYLANVLQNDPRLSDILDKVITVASEFSGAGEVEGPGTGVSDSIPARLSDGEFVFTRKATDQIGADQLQTIMDDAERAYDGGYQMKAIGGYMQEDPEEQDSPLSKTDEEIRKLMMGANKMPSLR